MKFLGFDNVLCLSPHPDDVEYSMSGTIIKYQDTKFNILTLSCGGDYDESTGNDRLKEVKAFWEQVNVDNVNLLFTDNIYLKERREDGWIFYIENEILSKNNYDCIVSTSNKDSHFEHRFVSNFPATLARKNDYSIIQYKSPSTFHNWNGNLSVDIDSYYDVKYNGLSIFKSQLRHFYFEEDVINSFHINWDDIKRKKGYSEQFKIIKLYN